jgi:Arc/MetJ family transcription regulator
MLDRRRLLALLEVYDTAIEELYVLEDRQFVDLILRLERRRRNAEQRLEALDHAATLSERQVETLRPGLPTTL